MNSSNFDKFDYCDFEKFLGSKKYWIEYERNRDKKTFDFCTYFFLLGIIFAILSNVFNNPIISVVFGMHFIISIIGSIMIKKTFIKNGPSIKKLINYIHTKELFFEFKYYLERKITPYSICEFINQPFYSNWTFNILFSGLFTFFIIFYSYYRKDITQSNAQIIASLYAIIFYSYIYLSIKIKRFWFEDDTIITLNALRELKRNKRRMIDS